MQIILCSLPRTLKTLKLRTPNYCVTLNNTNKNDIYKKETMRLVKKLCALQAARNNLETVVLNGINLPKQSKDYLTFMFGYTNGLSTKYLETKCEDLYSYSYPQKTIEYSLRM